MHSSELAAIVTIISLVSQFLAPINAHAAGIVSFALEMGSTSVQKYDFVFAGDVMSSGKMLPGAHVAVEISRDGANEDVVTETTDANAQGHFSIHVALSGKAEQATLWKITAKAPVIGAQPSELEGRSILSDESTLEVNRSIQLDSAGA